MNKTKPRELHTNRLDIRIPKYEDQYELWNIQKQEKVNIYYQSTPSRFKTRKEYQEHYKIGICKKMVLLKS